MLFQLWTRQENIQKIKKEDGNSLEKLIFKPKFEASMQVVRKQSNYYEIDIPHPTFTLGKLNLRAWREIFITAFSHTRPLASRSPLPWFPNKFQAFPYFDRGRKHEHESMSSDWIWHFISLFLFRFVFRNRSESRDSWGSRSNLSFKGDSDSPSTKSTLRRSKSIGTGIHNLETEISQSRQSEEELEKSRPSIIAEELPARNTVKNVRSVFEQILRKNGHVSPNILGTGTAELRTPLGDSNAHGGSIPNKVALRSVKSNPTSKIFRSESLKDDAGQYGTSILLKCNPIKEEPQFLRSTNQKYANGKEGQHQPNQHFGGNGSKFSTRSKNIRKSEKETKSCFLW